MLDHSHLPHLYLVTVSLPHPTPIPCSHLLVYLLHSHLQVRYHLLHLPNISSQLLHLHLLSLLQVNTIK